MKNKLTVLVFVGVLLLGAVLFFRLSGAGTAALWDFSQGGAWLLPLVAVSALIDSINPCAFSILLLTIAFLFSIGKIRRSVLAIGSSYIAGIFIVYMMIGLGILQTLHIFNTPHFMAKVGALLLIVLGLINVINEFFPAFPVKLRIPHLAHRKMAELMEKGSIATAFGLGALVGLCEFPCTGGPYLMVLGLLHDQATYLRGIGYLLLYNAIFVLPLVVILLISSDAAVMDKVAAWKREQSRRMRFWGGSAMVALGIIIFLL
ncbi:MAG: hypothetical protein A2131_00095 [Candidatus Sungbacteria bacterium GWC2_49_10]|uniref:Uncharacterized protein n=1 Tax=Candidatus Sungbacteria bacterium GWC2_49_10 TaxID=1802263 RepID=A0A1G2K2Q0_9BACT|nr:MAG: hypothetical protein A2131_00095 [Candidatus Sungbacteria bacterium GWC2_49_10]